MMTHVSERDFFLKECITNSSSKTNEQLIMYTHIYRHTLFDIFGPIVSFVYFWSTTTNNHKLRRGPSIEHLF